LTSQEAVLTSNDSCENSVCNLLRTFKPMSVTSTTITTTLSEEKTIGQPATNDSVSERQGAMTDSSRRNFESLQKFLYDQTACRLARGNATVVPGRELWKSLHFHKTPNGPVPYVCCPVCFSCHAAGHRPDSNLLTHLKTAMNCMIDNDCYGKNCMAYHIAVLVAMAMVDNAASKRILADLTALFFARVGHCDGTHLDPVGNDILRIGTALQKENGSSCEGNYWTDWNNAQALLSRFVAMVAGSKAPNQNTATEAFDPVLDEARLQQMLTSLMEATLMLRQFPSTPLRVPLECPGFNSKFSSKDSVFPRCSSFERKATKSKSLKRESASATRGHGDAKRSKTQA
jgi:hypothetical protein